MRVLALVLAAITYVEASSRGVYDANTLSKFESFVQRFNKVYRTLEEEEHAIHNFANHLISMAVEKNPAHGITKFFDLSPEEFKARYLTLKPLSASAIGSMTQWDGTCTACERFPHLAAASNGDIPAEFDWTNYGAVTGVKDQAQCGSCWAFATVADIEGTHFLAGNPLIELSEQQVVSCDVGRGDQGCGGGWMETAMQYIIDEGGLALEADYPYTSQKGGSAAACDKTKMTNFAAKITGFNMISSSAAGESNILAALSQVGPITIALDAAPMQRYKSGIDNPTLCGGPIIGSVNHAVTIVGYGTENGVDYWKIKNSWGTNWGENGYYRIVRGKNKCKLATHAVHSIHEPRASLVKSYRAAYDFVTLAQFDNFVQKFNKVYSSVAAEAHAIANFAGNLIALAEQNDEASGITKFFDLSPEEFKAKYLTLKPFSASERASMTQWDGTCTACQRFPHLAASNGDIPAEFDWTNYGAVTGVKDQAQCGSCWAFATVADIEGTHFLAGNPLIALSEQQIVSCDVGRGDQGCNGGWMETAMQYVINEGGLVLETDYPYTSQKGSAAACDKTKVKNFAAKITGFQMVSSKSSEESNILAALSQVGPITIALNASPMQSYTGGIHNPFLCGLGSVNHAVTIVGYGTENGVDYWKIKNSWGPDWGENGYYRIVRGKNKCNLATHAVHSIHESSSKASKLRGN